MTGVQTCALPIFGLSPDNVQNVLSEQRILPTLYIPREWQAGAIRKTNVLERG